MIVGLLVLLACQLAGEFVAGLLGLAVPGPVIGMVFLFVLLSLRRSPGRTSVLRVSGVLLDHLQLLFVPAGVGVVQYGAVLAGSAVAIAGGIVISWTAGLLVTAGAAALLLRLAGRRSS